MPEPPKPPSFALAILNCFSNEPDLPALIGDMSEEFHNRRESSGVRAARLWFWRDTLRNARALTAREVMRTPVRTSVIALGSVLAVNAVTAIYALHALPNALDPSASEWWTLLLLQFVTPLALGFIGVKLIPGRERALVLTYSIASACYAGAGIIVVERSIGAISAIHQSKPLWLLAIWGNGFRQGAFWLGCLAAILHRSSHGIVKRALKHFAGICILTMIGGYTLLGQVATVPAKWIGTWTLNVEKSTFGPPLMPGAPVGLKITSQTLRIEQTGEEIRLSGDTLYSDNSGSHTNHDGNSMNLDGKPKAVGPVSFSFRRIDDSTFDVFSELSLGGRGFEEVSHFSFSPDGRTLIETKTQKEIAAKDADSKTGAVTKTSTSVLVFSKRHEQ